MELVKELPEIFEEFAEQRQKSFLVMKEVKEKTPPKATQKPNNPQRSGEQ